jgi:hypothetical protein
MQKPTPQLTIAPNEFVSGFDGKLSGRVLASDLIKYYPKYLKSHRPYYKNAEELEAYINAKSVKSVVTKGTQNKVVKAMIDGEATVAIMRIPGTNKKTESAKMKELMRFAAKAVKPAVKQAPAPQKAKTVEIEKTVKTPAKAGRKAKETPAKSIENTPNAPENTPDGGEE